MNLNHIFTSYTDSVMGMWSNLNYDGQNAYLYDAEGRLCAVQGSVMSGGHITGYIYDASGTRVAKGSLTNFSCNFATNGFAPTASYVLGPGGEQVTEYAVNGAPGGYRGIRVTPQQPSSILCRANSR